MGNSPSVQEHQQQPHGVLDANHPFRRAQLGNEMSSGRQQSITSQLFPSRNTRHVGPHSMNAKRNRHPHPQPPSLFKSDYSLRSTAEETPANTGSTENIRDNMAGLSLKSSNENAQVPSFLTPGHSTPTVQPTRQAAVPAADLKNKLQNGLNQQKEISSHRFQRPSVVALKKTLLDDGELHSTSSRSTSGDVVSSASLDIYSALNLDSPTQSGSKAKDTDADPDTSDFDDISDDGYLQSEDVVLNQSLLQNVLRRDMKRKRPAKKSKVPNTSHVSNLKASSNSASYESLENGNVPDAKKLKSLSYDGSLPSFQPTAQNNDRLNGLAHDNGFNRIDSFEKGSVEHREVETSPTMRNSSSASPSSSSIISNTEPEKVHVILKWRDQIEDPSKCKITIISTDIASALNFDPSDKSFHGTFSMKYDEKENNFYVPNLSLPPGIYKFQFVINGEIRHSNLLPSATDSVGNIVNWFEVIPGYESVEPFRNEIDYHENMGIDPPQSDSSTSTGKHHDESPGKVPLVQPVPGRPPLAARHTSSYSNKQERSGTPYSDYTGVSRCNSAVRKSPLIHQTLSSIDLVTALQPKKYEYSNEIPELFKAGNVLGQSDENQFPTPPPPPMNPPSYDQPSFLENVVDCNQDNLFVSLQQGGLLDAETAEQLFLEKYTVPDLPVYLNSTYLNKIFNEFQKHNSLGSNSSGLNHIIPHVNLNHLLTSSIRDEMISVGCTTRYEGKFITQVVYAPCYYASGPKAEGKK